MPGTHPPSLSFPRGRGKIALVLDDWGYNVNQMPALQAIRRPLTIAVLPNLPYSGEVARVAHSRGHEVILHLPMESADPNAPREAGTILGTMSREEILSLLQRGLESVPFAKGLSNHQGSKATVNRPVMEILLREIQRKRLYFLDSFVTEKSVCDELAQDLQIRFARRTVFLDNEMDPPAIRQRLLELAEAARRNGNAIGIGHDRPVTLNILREAIPALRKAGYRLVTASELAEVPE